MLLGKEPTLILYTVQGVLQSVSVFVFPWSTSTDKSIHAVVALLLAVVTAVINRATVTPSP